MTYNASNRAREEIAPKEVGMHMTVDEAGKNFLLLYIPSLEFGARWTQFILSPNRGGFPIFNQHAISKDRFFITTGSDIVV